VTTPVPTGVFITASNEVAGVLTFFLPTARQLTITGSAASFPFPLYSVRFSTYGAKTERASLDDPSIGSGAGVRNFIDRIVDCGASDATMTDEEIAQLDGGVVLLAMTAGEIDRRHDARIAAANPDAAPPDRPRGSGGLSGGHAHLDAVRS
jgi:ABC-type phosphate transport system substrate-binding protein